MRLAALGDSDHLALTQVGGCEAILTLAVLNPTLDLRPGLIALHGERTRSIVLSR